MKEWRGLACDNKTEWLDVESNIGLDDYGSLHLSDVRGKVSAEERVKPNASRH